MTLRADCSLFPSGRRAAEHISEVLEEQGPEAARKTAQNQYGWEPLGSGVARVAFSPADDEEQIAFTMSAGATHQDYVEGGDECVIKIGSGYGRQMSAEIRQWQFVNGERLPDRPKEDEDWTALKPAIAPVKDYDPHNYRWLTMPKGNTDGVAHHHVSDVKRFVEEQGFLPADVHGDNVALYEGEPRIIDLGHDFKFTGFTENERWNRFEDRLERWGCRDVYAQSKRRQFMSFKFLAPLDLPGPPNEQGSEVMLTKGAQLKELDLKFTVIPDEFATGGEVATIMDEVIDTQEAWRGVRVVVEGDPNGWAPEVRSSAVNGEPLSEIEPFIAAVYDRYDNAFSAVVPEEWEHSSEGSPPSAPSGTPILEQIEDDVEFL